MDVHTDAHSTCSNTSQNSLVEGLTVDHEREPGKTVLNDEPASDELSSSSSNRRPSLVTDTEAHEEQSPVHPIKADQEPLDTEMAKDHDQDYLHPQCNSDPTISITASQEVSLSECVIGSVGGSSSSANIDDSEARTPQEPPLSRARTVSPAAAPCEEGEAGSIDCPNDIQISHTELDHVHSSGLARPTNEEEDREDSDYPCEDLPSSLPPNSSPPQLFSSSPCASSQSSLSGDEPSKMVPGAQNESRLEPKDFHTHSAIDDARSPEADQHCSQMNPTSCIEGGSQPSRKRVTHLDDAEESCRSQLIKRPREDPHLVPNPKRTTLASQNRQFKKLAAPFRPPLKLPVVMDGLVQVTNKAQSAAAISIMPKTSRDETDAKGPSVHLLPLRHKTSNTPKSIAQFKSPLINKVLPADARTIRLTPAVQALERKLQLLKRAIKVKEDQEEEVLTRLAGKWTEAGREAAYNLWDVTKDAGDLERRVPSACRSYGWEGTSNGNTHWGWDNKPGNEGEESCNFDPSMARCDVERLAEEADEDDVGYYTLGTMLRQLGIAPEILGWDDEKEAFSD